MREAIHDLHLTEHALVVSVQDTTERRENGEKHDLSILEKTSPTLVSILDKDGVKVAACSCSTSHD